MEALTTFCFAHQIEQSLVALCFQAPDRIAIVKRELDLEIHLTRPELRQILEAIDLAYRELGSSDFATVIQILAEQNRLEDCGGLAGVNAVLEEYRYGFASSQIEDRIFAHYLEMLKAYALGRATNSRVYRFNRGDLTLATNKTKSAPTQPDLVGTGKIAGHLYRALGWKSAQNISISLIPL